MDNKKSYNVKITLDEVLRHNIKQYKALNIDNDELENIINNRYGFI